MANKSMHLKSLHQSKELLYYNFKQNQPQGHLHKHHIWTKQTSCFSSEHSINDPSTNVFIKMTSLHFKIHFSNMYLWVIKNVVLDKHGLDTTDCSRSFSFPFSEASFPQKLETSIHNNIFRLNASTATQHIRRGSHKERETRSNSAARGVTLLVGVPGIGWWVVSVLPGRISEASRGRDWVRCRGVSQALVPPLWGRRRRHGGGGHREGVLWGGREETCVLRVFGTGHRPKVHLVGSPQKGPP